MLRNLLLTCALLFLCSAVHSEDPAAPIPFDRGRVNRYSLDGVPRSISLRQGDAVWLGYDLERATVMKVWRAPEGKAGLTAGFTPRSVGTTLFEDATGNGWRLRAGASLQSLEVRYLGITQARDHFQLRWELQGDSRRWQLEERVPLAGRHESSGAVRELRVTGLKSGEALLPPAAVSKAWKSSTGEAVPSLSTDRWVRLVLP